jgi:hypothetical protein
VEKSENRDRKQKIQRGKERGEEKDRRNIGERGEKEGGDTGI